MPDCKKIHGRNYDFLLIILDNAVICEPGNATSPLDAFSNAVPKAHTGHLVPRFHRHSFAPKSTSCEQQNAKCNSFTSIREVDFPCVYHWRRCDIFYPGELCRACGTSELLWLTGRCSCVLCLSVRHLVTPPAAQACSETEKQVSKQLKMLSYVFSLKKISQDLFVRSYLFHILKDEVELPSPAEGLLQLHNILLLEGAEHLELPQCCFLNLLIFCMEIVRNHHSELYLRWQRIRQRPLKNHVSPSLSLNFLMATISFVSCN